MSEPVHVRVAVVGAGFGGLGMALRLVAEGVGDFVVLERAEAVGGVWRDNVYPGAACDVHSHLYELAAAPNPRWSRRFSAQPEIRAYLERVADAGGLRRHLRLGHDVEGAAWDPGARRWRIATDRGGYTADVLVAATGGLSEPLVPDLPGLDAFAGPVVHTARWPDGLDLAGRRVAVVGTGASAVQVVPAIQPEVEHLTLFQRTPPWVMARRDAPVGEAVRRRFERWPRLQRAVRRALYGVREGFGLAFRNASVGATAEALARRHLRAQVPDPALRRRLTPDYRYGCKRVLLSDDYYPALTRPNVTVTGAAARVRPDALVDAEGAVHPADVVVLATGFHVHDHPFMARVAGRGGRTLAETWGPSPVAHLGTTVAGFPNFFLLQGPNTGLGHTSVILMMEAQIDHVAHALGAMRRRRLAAVEPRPEAQAAWVAEVDALAEGTTWTVGGCRSWYLDGAGRNGALWPGSVGAFRRRVAPFDPAEYRLTLAAEPAPA